MAKSNYVPRDRRTGELEFNERPAQRIVRGLRHFDRVERSELFEAIGVPSVECLESRAFQKALSRLVAEGVVERVMLRVGAGTRAYHETWIRLTGKPPLTYRRLQQIHRRVWAERAARAA